MKLHCLLFYKITSISEGDHLAKMQPFLLPPMEIRVTEFIFHYKRSFYTK